MDVSNIIKADCSKCLLTTNHSILFLKSVEPPTDFHYWAETKYFVLQCAGCDNISFVKEFHDYENSFTNDFNESEYETTINSYPPFIKGYKELEDIDFIPFNIKQRYKLNLEEKKQNA